MITFSDNAFVWIFLPESITPVVAGRIQKKGDRYLFTYGQSYLKRSNAISIYSPELPLLAGTYEPKYALASCIRDASPDAWGRRVIIHNLTQKKRTSLDSILLDELTFLLHSGSDRIGNLDFQLSATEYFPRMQFDISIEELSTAVSSIEKGKPIPDELETALLHGTSIGGARPKILVNEKDKKYIAKFSSTTDYYSVIQAEYLAMRFAKLAGISVATVQLKKVAGKDVLLIERFDRVNRKEGWHRLGIVSALTILGLDEMEARYASYEDLAVKVRHLFTEPKKTLKELFTRMVFNILVGNTDDHARNHAAFWNGTSLSLTPAYDICPQGRSGQTASQAMKIYGENNQSQLVNCLYSAPSFLLEVEEAMLIIQSLIHTIADAWENVCKEADISLKDKALFQRNQFFNPYIFYGIEEFSDKIKNPWKYDTNGY